MTNPIWAALASILMSVMAQFALKRGMAVPVGAALEPRSLLAIASNKYILIGLLLYALGAVVWLSVLARWDVSKAYPLVGLGFVLTAIVGFVLGEAVSGQRALGVATICVGVWLVART